MEDYKEKYKIGDRVRGKRTFNGETVEGEFHGFHLCNKLNPNSVVCVIITDDGCYDVSVDSLESVESEDERIRKELIAWLERKQLIPSETKNEWIDWLEKKEQKSTEWSEKDEKISNAIYESIDFLCLKTCGFSEDDVCVWIKSLKDRVQPKQEWSEEDERMKSLIISTLTSMGTLNLERYHHMNLDEVKNWFKSIKPQKHWKPSEEQLRAIINSAQGLYQCKEKEVLLDLYEQLKNL